MMTHRAAPRILLKTERPGKFSALLLVALSMGGRGVAEGEIPVADQDVGAGSAPPRSASGVRGQVRRAHSVLPLLTASLTAVIVSAVAWLSWASALGDRTTAMVVALSATCATCAAFLSRVARGKTATIIATAAFGTTPAIALATLRALSEPLMGEAFVDSAARQREGFEAVIIAVVLAALCAGGAAVIAHRRLQERRVSRVLLAVLTWSPMLVVPVSLAFALAEGHGSPSPSEYGTSQPVLAHMDPAHAGEDLLIDEVARKEGITLVRVCEGKPWCYTLLRRGDRVTTRPGLVPRDAPVHLRYDPNHRLYLVETEGELVSTISAENLASYGRLLPRHVRRSVTPPGAFALLAGLGLLAAVVIFFMRSRLRRSRERAAEAAAGVCFGDGWGLFADGTSMRVPLDMACGSILVLWSHGRHRTLTVLEGTREEIAKRFEQRGHAFDALQLSLMWTLCTPLVIAVAVV